MEAAILDWLQQFGWTAFTLSAGAFVLVNAVALTIFLRRGDRDLVNRWTPRLLAVNLVLAGTGLGIPVLATAARFAIVAASPTLHIFTTPSSPSDEEQPDPRAPRRAIQTIPLR